MADGKWIDGLTAAMPVADAARITLAARFAVVPHFLPLAVEKPHDDTEYVHQLRVGTRRAGAALRVFATCLPAKRRKEARRCLRAVRRASGDARDWDVFRIGLRDEKALAGAAGKSALDFLAGYALGERSAAQTGLADAATAAGPRLTELAAEIPAAVHEPRDDDPPADFGAFAGTRFGELLAAFDEAVKANPTDAPGLHALRILGKRARYALEIFAGCFPPEFKGIVYPAVERVQEILGGMQDAAVQTERLAAIRDRARKADPAAWARAKAGFEGLLKARRAALPAGRRAFRQWRTEWAKLIAGVKLGVAAAVATG